MTGSAEQDGAVIEPSSHCLGGTVAGQPLCRTAFCRHYIHIHTARTVAAEGDMFAVGTPEGSGVVGRIGGQLTCRTTFGGYGIDVAHIREGNLLAVGTDSDRTQPERRIACQTVQRACRKKQRCGKELC